MQLKKNILLLFLLFGYNYHVLAFDNKPSGDTISTSTQQQAIAFIDKVTSLPQSNFWPKINPSLFLQNVKTNIYEPLSFYAGRGTNFCGYGALTYLFIQDDPLGYVKLMLALYTDGKASFRKVHFDPSPEIKEVAGSLKYKGIMDIHPADQMWCLSLADHFKGYVNIFNRKYDPGDEDRFWASVNYAKFNRMVTRLLNYKIHARGSDLMHPSIADTYEYIREKMKTGLVVLYVNNRILHKKKQEKIKLGIPTHFIVLESMIKTGETITMVYWDYGGKTLRQLTPYFLHKITFGISYCTKRKANEN